MIVGLFVFVLGLVFGSFINAIIYREENNLSLKGRSICPNCKKELKWYELFPVVSWIIQRGKCKGCNCKISFQYPFTELLTAIAFLSVGIKSGLIYQLNNYLFNLAILNKEFVISKVTLCFLLLTIFCLILVAVYDAKTKYVLSKYVYLGIVFTLIYLIMSYNNFYTFWNLVTYMTPYFLAASVPAFIFFLISYLSKGTWMGEGDAEIVLLIGLFLGWPKVLVALYFAFIVGAIYGLGKIYLSKAKMKSEVPFGPFLIAGCFTAFLFGEQLIQFYVRIFLGG